MLVSMDPGLCIIVVILREPRGEHVFGYANRHHTQHLSLLLVVGEMIPPLVEGN